MEITEVRVKLVANKDDRLKGFCSMTLDNEFVVRDIKVIEGTSGLFVAMPSRKMSDHCDKCGGKNHLRARFCNNCGAALSENRAKKDDKGRMKLHADIAHPINAECRRRIQEQIVAAIEEELEKSQEPGYRPADLDETDDFDIPDAVG
jgi:stage V sporulation protein G